MKTGFERNTFGSVTKTSLSYKDPIIGALNKTIAEVIYTTNGRFPEKITNALGHYENKTFDARNGAPVSNIDINGLTTAWEVDGFGRKVKQTNPDGTSLYTYQKQCTTSCPSGAVSVLVNDTMRGDVRVAVPSLVFSDSAGHPVRSITWGFDGKMIGSQIVYDGQGRVRETYQPRLITNMVSEDVANGAILGVRNYYDDLNRITQTEFWDDAQLQSNTTTYDGLVITVKNAKGQNKTDTKDVGGRLTQSKDANGSITKFEHDPYNNLTKTTDPKLNVVEIEYDDLGRRIKLSDPDLGVNEYVVNPIGQVIKQTSPLQRRKFFETSTSYSTTMKYDDLGRMTERNEFDLKGRWIYDNQSIPLNQTCRTTKICGKLIESYTLINEGKDNQQTHVYDSLGRPSITTLQRDTSYVQSIEYDAWGRPLKETQQRGAEAAKVFERRYNAFGYQFQLLRGDSSNYQVLWQANKQDASQKILQAALGNSLVVDRNYYANTGRLHFATLKTNGGTQQLFENYSYDALGNVTERNQQWAADSVGGGANGFIELFSYDGLNRLENASVIGFPTQTFTYNEIGNITSKTGVGSYTYPDSGNVSPTSFGIHGASIRRPHAVANITSLGNFSYDDNGNLLSGAGRTVSWTSFDMPQKISKGSDTSTFTYGADHQRTKQIKNDGSPNSSTVYYAGAMEVETKAGVVQSIKTYWPGGIGFETDKPNQATDLNWIHTDRIGNVIAITDPSGALVERLAYDSWGKRRSLSGNETPDSLDGVKDNKGFTGHEMLDKLDLVHMNGRIYDPLVARFMSADPIIQDPTHSQSYNRYTYVWNNPTNLTDPTGFQAAGENVSQQSDDTEKCDMACKENRKRYDRCVDMVGNCSHYGTTGYENAPSNTKDHSGKALSTVSAGGRSELKLYEYTKNPISNEWSSGVEVDQINTEHAFLNGIRQ